MKKSRNNTAIKRNNQASNSKGTGKNTVSTSKVSTSPERIDVRIPKNSKIYQYLHVDTTIIKAPKWRLLDAILTRAEDNSTKQAELIFDEFVARMGVYFPEKKKRIENLRALVLWYILWGEDIAESYWEKLRERGP